MAIVVATVAVWHLTDTGPGRTKPPPAASGGSPSPASEPYWLINAGELQILERSGLSAAVTSFFFDNDHTLLIVSGTNSTVERSLPRALDVQSFTSLASIVDAFSTEEIRPETRYILYDNEAWSLTPRAEQLGAIASARQVEALVHHHGLKMIFTPGTNLAPVIGGVPATEKYEEYLRLNLAGAAARVSDVLDIQAQQAEGTPEFDVFARTAVGQARQANPKAVVLVGLSTDPAGRAVSSQELLSDYAALSASAMGYWLNLPSRGTKCPNCGSPDPQVAGGFLTQLYEMVTGHGS